MKTTQSSSSVVCCAALFLITTPLIGRAASKNLVLKDAEPQYAGKLCWAAADVLAVNQFYPNCPSSPSTPTATTGLFPTSQALEAGFNVWSHPGNNPPNPPPTLGDLVSGCENNNGIQGIICNTWGNPALNGLTYNQGTDPGGLQWETIVQEIEAGHPILFVWNYPPDYTGPDNTGDSPVGRHELVITGYSDDTGTRKLQIWDPWPVPLLPPDNDPPSQVPACGPANGVPVTEDHSQPIFFSTYSNPESDMGVEAVHEKDLWGLAMVVEGGPPAPSPAPQPVERLSLPPQAPVQVSFAQALSAALHEAKKLDLQVPGAPPRSLGVPFPIVGLGFKQLLDAGDEPTKLLAGSTSAVLFPVKSQGKVVDAFLMLFRDRRWHRGGYANVEITRRLVDVRASHASAEHPQRSFYMVSVPGEVAFFAAYGKGKQAVMIPVSTDRSIEAKYGAAVLAEKQLRNLTQAIRVDLQRDRDRGRNPLRPVG